MFRPIVSAVACPGKAPRQAPRQLQFGLRYHFEMLVPSLIFLLGLAAPQPRVERELTEAAGLLAKGSIPEAITLLRGIVKTHPRNAQAHLLLGSALALAPRR